MASSASGQLDRASLARLLTAADADIKTISCEFQGSLEQTAASGKEGRADEVSGSFKQDKAAGRWSLDVYHRFERDGGVVYLESLASDGARTQERGRDENEPMGGVEIRLPSYRDIDRQGSIGRIFCTDLLLGYLQDESAEMEHEGTVQYRSRGVQLVAFRRFPANDKRREPFWIERFWIDLPRGGRVVRREIRNRDGDLTASTEIELAQFRADDGKTIWFPSKGTHYYYDLSDGESVEYISEPTAREDVMLIADGTRFNLHIDALSLELAIRDKTYLTDRLNKTRRLFDGADATPPRQFTREEAEKQLELQLAEAESRQTELDASAMANTMVRRWATVALSLVAVVAMVLAIVLKLRRMR